MEPTSVGTDIKQGARTLATFGFTGTAKVPTCIAMSTCSKVDHIYAVNDSVAPAPEIPRETNQEPIGQLRHVVLPKPKMYACIVMHALH